MKKLIFIIAFLISLPSVGQSVFKTVEADTIKVKGKSSNDFLLGDGTTTNIKTVNGNSLLGSGDLSVSSKQKYYISHNNRFVNSAADTWYSWERTQNVYSNTLRALGTGATPSFGSFESGFAIPQGFKVNKVVIWARDLSNITDMEFYFAMRYNNSTNGDYLNNSGSDFSFDELANEFLLDGTVLTNFNSHKKTITMDTALGVNEALNQDKELLFAFRTTGANTGVIFQFLIEIEEI